MSKFLQRQEIPSALVNKGGLEQLERDLQQSATLYVGNLSFFTTEEQLHHVFSKCGEIKRIIMGLDRNKKTPYYHRDDALDAVKYINGTKVDERIIRTDIDPGFTSGRQYGRGRSGGQVRDEWREEYDEGRGGWGARIREEEMREQQQKDVYQSSSVIPQGFTAEPDYQPSTTAASNKRSLLDDEPKTYGYSKRRQRDISP